jgi:prophage regulatory protein
MPTVTLWRVEQVSAARARSRSRIYAEIDAGLFPPPIKRGRKLSVWPSHEVDLINRAEIAGATDDEIRTLVRQLIEQRSHAREAA